MNKKVRARNRKYISITVFDRQLRTFYWTSRKTIPTALNFISEQLQEGNLITQVDSFHVKRGRL